jgi:hypothetical protein
MRVDNFLLALFQTCPAKYKLRAKEHWTSRRRSGALGFGGAIHEGLAEWYRSGDREKALIHMATKWPTNLPIDDWRTKEKGLNTLAQYIREYPTENFSIVGAPEAPMVECTFTFATGLYLYCWECGDIGNDNPDNICDNCGEPLEEIEYGGIFDGLVNFAGSVYVLEHKTTSQLGKYYFNQFKPNNQITGYIWGAGLLSGQPVGGALVNALGVYKVSEPKFERQLTNRSQSEIEEWLANVRNTCLLIQDCERRGTWPLHTAACCLYGKCEYHDVHVLGTENERRKRLETDYIQEVWDYENRDDNDQEGAA